MSLNLQPKGGGGAAEHVAAGGDVRSRLRAAQALLARDKVRGFVLPGYDTDNPELGGGQLVIRYKRLLFEDIQRIFIEERGDKDIVGVNTQFLVEACDEIVLRDENGTHQLVDGHKTTFTVNLESGESLASVMGFDHLPTVRAQLVEMLGGNEMVLCDHSGEVIRWMETANAEDAEKALGER